MGGLNTDLHWLLHILSWLRVCARNDGQFGDLDCFLYFPPSLLAR